METKKRNLTSKAKALTVLLFVFSSTLLLTCITLHINPLQLEMLIFDFAVHHYFIFGFICLLLVLFSVKLYFSLYHKALKKSENIRSIIRESLDKKSLKSNLKKSSIDFIEKENIEHLDFPQEDVLTNREQKKIRELELKKSMSLGNQYKQKVKIFFKDKNRNLYTETTVWQADQKYISLKGGVSLPVRSVYQVII